MSTTDAELKAVNICLETGAGVDPISAVGENDAETARVLNKVRDARKDILSEGYEGLNIDKVDLVRENDGKIPIPETFLMVDLPKPYTVRDNYVYDYNERSYKPGQDFLDRKVSLDVPLDQLPHVAFNAIAYEAAKLFCLSVLGAGHPQYAECVRLAGVWEVALGTEYPHTLKSQATSASYRGRVAELAWEQNGRLVRCW